MYKIWPNEWVLLAPVGSNELLMRILACEEREIQLNHQISTLERTIGKLRTTVSKYKEREKTKKTFTVVNGSEGKTHGFSPGIRATSARLPVRDGKLPHVDMNDVVYREVERGRMGGTRSPWPADPR